MNWDSWDIRDFESKPTMSMAMKNPLIRKHIRRWFLWPKLYRASVIILGVVWNLHHPPFWPHPLIHEVFPWCSLRTSMVFSCFTPSFTKVRVQRVLRLVAKCKVVPYHLVTKSCISFHCASQSFPLLWVKWVLGLTLVSESKCRSFPSPHSLCWVTTTSTCKSYFNEKFFPDEAALPPKHRFLRPVPTMLTQLASIPSL